METETELVEHEAPENVVKAFSQALADEDIKKFKETLKAAVHADGNVSWLAKNAGLSRGTLYKAMHEGSDTGLGTLLRLFHAMGYEMVVTKRVGKIKRAPGRVTEEKSQMWKKFVSFFSREE